MGDAIYGQCHYCGDSGLLRITYFSFPIKCNCCNPYHSTRIEHCVSCEAKMPTETKIRINTTKLLDPIHENLFTKLP
jgi:hypothetical protein